MLLSGWLNDARGELLAEFKVASFCSTIEAIMEANCWSGMVAGPVGGDVESWELFAWRRAVSCCRGPDSVPRGAGTKVNVMFRSAFLPTVSFVLHLQSLHERLNRSALAASRFTSAWYVHVEEKYNLKECGYRHLLEEQGWNVAY